MDKQNIPLCKHGVTDQDYECLECNNTTKTQTVLRNSRYEDMILELIDNQDDFTRSDLQGVVSALVMRILADK